MPASTKDELLAVCQKEFGKLTKLLDQIESRAALVKDQDDTSIRDIVGHRAHWIRLSLGWYEHGRVRREVFFPAKGYKWNELKRYNAELRTTQSSMGWEESRSELQDAYDELIGFITNSPETELYGGPMAGANNQWTPGRWAEAAGPSHFRSAAKYIRARRREN